MEDTAEKLAIRDSFLRKLAARKTPDERMRDMWRIRQSAWDAMRRTPGAWELYKRHQLKKRAIDARPEYIQ